MQLVAIGLATGLATFCGGALALRIDGRRQLLSAFGGGAMIGVALADLLPEALSLSSGSFAAGRPAAGGVSPLAVTSLTLVGFVLYMAASTARARLGAARPGRALGPASLIAHSLMDGIGIGLAFTVSQTAAIAVAGAVLTHDLVDGANTVTLSFSGDQRRSRAWAWLAADALAPLVGIGLSRLVDPSPRVLAPLLALFAGFFLYIATGELLPQAGGEGRRTANLLATAAGVAAATAIALVGSL